jgi:hypothetical protein
MNESEIRRTKEGREEKKKENGTENLRIAGRRRWKLKKV